MAAELEELRRQLRVPRNTVNTFKLVREQTKYVYTLLCEAYAAEVKSRGHVPLFTEMTKKAIWELATFLTDPKDSRFSVMLCGTTGNGKSTLHRAFNRFWSVMIDNHIAWTLPPYLRDAKMYHSIMANPRNWEEVLTMRTWVGIEDMGKEPSESMQWGRITTPVQDLIEFRYDKTKPAASRVQASRYACTIDADGNITKGDRTQVEVAANVINTMLDQLMDQLIIVMPEKSKTVEDYVAEGYNYFKSRGGSMVRVTKNAAGQLCFEGGWQMEHNHKLIPSTERYQKENGVSYQLDEALPLGAQRSLYMTLREHSEYQAFMNLLENDYSDLLTQKLSNKYNPGNAALDNKNLKLFDNYNYTVYIPTNESIEKIQDLTEDGHSGKNAILPSWSELEMGDENDEVIDSICKAEGWYDSNPNRATVLTNVKAAIKTIVTDFIRYHVHDNSVAIGMAHDPSKDSKYESMKRNLETGRFYPITVKYDTKNMTITDNAGNERHVITTNPALYNNVVREYWFEGKDRTARLFMGSGAVVHLIDGPLEYEQLKPWRDVVKEAIFN